MQAIAAPLEPTVDRQLCKVHSSTPSAASKQKYCELPPCQASWSACAAAALQADAARCCRYWPYMRTVRWTSQLPCRRHADYASPTSALQHSHASGTALAALLFDQIVRSGALPLLACWRCSSLHSQKQASKITTAACLLADTERAVHVGGHHCPAAQCGCTAH